MVLTKVPSTVEAEYAEAEKARIIAEEEKEEAIRSREANEQIVREYMAYYCAGEQAKENALWSYEVERQIWREFMMYHCKSQRPRACTRVGKLLDVVVEWWESK